MERYNIVVIGAGWLVVMGGGPIGTELEQAFARLGTNVTIVSSTPHVCAKEDPDVNRALGDAYMRTKLTPGAKARLTKVYRWLRR